MRDWIDVFSFDLILMIILGLLVIGLECFFLWLIISFFYDRRVRKKVVLEGLVSFIVKK